MKAGDIYVVQEDGNLKKLTEAEIEERKLGPKEIHHHYHGSGFHTCPPCYRHHVSDDWALPPYRPFWSTGLITSKPTLTIGGTYSYADNAANSTLAALTNPTADEN